MITNGVLSDLIPKEILSDTNTIGEKLSDLLEMVEVSQQYNTNYLKQNDDIYCQESNGQIFANWLYDRSIPELTDMKRELCKIIDKSISLESDKYQSILETLVTERTSLDCVYFLVTNQKGKYNVWTKIEYYDMKRCYLSKHTQKNGFWRDVSECFPNIYLDRHVENSLNTLNNDFTNIVAEIVNHLSYLDSYFPSFIEHRKNGDSFITISMAFKEYSGIDCSPQSGRDSIGQLKRTYLNLQTQSAETICCELHTKFRTFNRDRKKQDRIYFHPGKDGINSGKVIVIHIGTHL